MEHVQHMLSPLATKSGDSIDDFTFLEQYAIHSARETGGFYPSSLTSNIIAILPVDFQHRKAYTILCFPLWKTPNVGA